MDKEFQIYTANDNLEKQIKAVGKRFEKYQKYSETKVDTSSRLETVQNFFRFGFDSGQIMSATAIDTINVR
jgi:phage-related tail protein